MWGTDNCRLQPNSQICCDASQSFQPLLKGLDLLVKDLFQRKPLTAESGEQWVSALTYRKTRSKTTQISSPVTLCGTSHVPLRRHYLPTGSDCQTGTICGITVHTKKAPVNRENEYERQRVNIWLVRHRSEFMFENNLAQRGCNSDSTWCCPTLGSAPMFSSFTANIWLRWWVKSEHSQNGQSPKPFRAEDLGVQFSHTVNHHCLITIKELHQYIHLKLSKWT